MIAERYTLDREIGRGGMGAVWLGRDEVLGRAVALKRVGMPPAGAGDNPEVARAEREAKLAASLSHPHVVSVFDLAPDGDDQWLVMEYVEGTNLAELIKANGSLPPDQAAPILAQTADALIAAHRAGVVHRDVKPSNILVTVDGQVKLSDFGIARTLGDPSLTQTGLVTGSPAYLSPEVASGRSASAASDIWSLGATAYHAIEGHPPYELGDNLLGALYRIVHEDPPRPAAPGWLAPLFEATMTDETQRWDATQVRDFLTAGPGATVAVPRARSRRPRPTRPPQAAAAAAPATTQVLQAAAPPPASPPRTTSTPVPAPPGRSRRRATWALVAAAVAAVALVAFLLLSSLGGPDDTTTAEPDPSPTSPTAAPTSAAPSPTAEGIETFAREYLATAPSDPRRGFSMLTRDFQDASGGFGKYNGFWSTVRNVRINSVTPDPAGPSVTYDYSYRSNGQDREETITLSLRFQDGTYLIAGES